MGEVLTLQLTFTRDFSPFARDFSPFARDFSPYTRDFSPLEVLFPMMPDA